MAICLVTGGAGFIGSHLVERLVALNHKVRVLDNLSTGSRENLANVLDAIELIEGDIAEPEVCERAVEGVEWVFHQAAAVSVPHSVDHPDRTHRTNIDGTFWLLHAARRAGVKKFIFAASSSAYGDGKTSSKRETDLPLPISPYAASKLAGEYYCRVFAACYGMKTVSLRYFNVFGPRQNPKSQYAAAIPKFITAILNDEPPTIFGDGEQTRDFTFVENVVRANILAAETDDLAGQTINIATGNSYSINFVVAEINRILGKDVKPRYAPPRPGDVRHSRADISLAKTLLGYEPTISFQEGLAKTVEWYAKKAQVAAPRRQSHGN